MKLSKNVVHKHAINSFNTLKTRFNNTHGNTYDYSKVIFINSQTAVIITCPIHGDFEQTPVSHIRGSGCPKCAAIAKGVASKIRHKNNRITTEDWIEKVSNIHSSKYTYKKTKYVNADTKVTITCCIHGDFKQMPYSHEKGHGCSKCANILTTSKFIKKASIVHKGKYLYFNTNYVRHDNTVSITCPIHGDFEQEAHNHLRGHGCSLCSTRGFKKHLPAILYYFKIVNNNEEYFKVGITNNTLTDRYTKEELDNCEILYEEPFNLGIGAYILEQLIINSSKQYRANLSLLKNGNTEIFTNNIFDYTKRKYYEIYKTNTIQHSAFT